jgi:outer membrane lipoprotein-sorting protein
MRPILIALMAVLAGFIANARRASAADTDASIDQVLNQLDQVGKNLKEFSAKLSLKEEDNLGSDVTHAGNVFFQKNPDGNVRIHVIFDQRVSNGTKAAEKTEYLLDGQWLYDRNYRAKNETKRQVLQPGQKMDLFKLGEGPFPLPIGQSAADVRNSFDVTKPAPAKDDLPGTVHLLLVPKANTELAKKFHSIEVYVDQKTHMPVRVITEDVKQQRTSTTDMTNLALNPPGGLKEADFQLPNIENQGWERSVDSMKN